MVRPYPYSAEPNGLEAKGGSWQPEKGLGPLSSGESEESSNGSQANLTPVISES